MALVFEPPTSPVFAHTQVLRNRCHQVGWQQGLPDGISLVSCSGLSSDSLRLLLSLRHQRLKNCPLRQGKSINLTFT